MLDRKLQEPLPITIYTPESRLRRPLSLLAEIKTDLLSSKELAWQMFYRNIQARYRQSALGPLWALIPPILIALTSTILRQGGVITAEETGIPYTLYVMFATILWQAFAGSIVLPLNAMKVGIQLLKTIRVPVEGLVLASVYELLFDLIVQILVFLGMLAILGFSLSWGAIPAIGALTMLIFLGIGFGLFLLPIGSLYTDVTSALPFLTRFWFFLTPVIYTPPEEWPYSLVVDLNPVTPLLLTTLDLSIQGTTNHVVGFTVVSILACFLLVVGWIFYRVSIPMLVER